ncbi:hypothetical protein [Brachybacterium subflavum]|uniref:hypothetical protein n=1 Tax=Brachybacterium subflavum TaxID=2585206 RepID=UPI0038730EAF
MPVRLGPPARTGPPVGPNGTALGPNGTALGPSATALGPSATALGPSATARRADGEGSFRSCAHHATTWTSKTWMVAFDGSCTASTVRPASSGTLTAYRL